MTLLLSLRAPEGCEAISSQTFSEKPWKTGFVKIYELTDIIDAQTIGKENKTIDEEDAFIV